MNMSFGQKNEGFHLEIVMIITIARERDRQERRARIELKGGRSKQYKDVGYLKQVSRKSIVGYGEHSKWFFEFISRYDC